MKRILIAFIACLALTAMTIAQGPANDQMALGKTTYMTVCFACHQPTGLGLPPVFPPIVKSPYVNGSAERFAAMILKGNAGPMTIDGKLYNTIMPGQEVMLSDEKIAAVMTYTRANFGNNAPSVVPEVVKAARMKFTERKAPWTQPELDAWKEGGAVATPAAAPTQSAVATTPPAGENATK